MYKFIKCNAKDLIDKLHERAKENKRKAMGEAERNNYKKNKNIRFSSAEPQRKTNNQHNTPVHENKEITIKNDVSETTVKRIKN
ncbi:hypothetical protein WL510_06530 [Staphylococcus saprophyticus]|uniref:hypothetical protein n=1 Tax=Staphylococcus saprophyticus TaxID=29385 RepID=UPI000F82E49E|nr:hypothetical protein [Staphylococcus saprophyticus]RTX66574.1 hypothetical protein CD119_008125 [Staphylococcus saprophyticus]